MRAGRALRTVREIRLERGGASAMDLASTVYVGALTVLIVGVPALRAVVLELAEPDASAALRAHGPTAAAVVAGLAATGLLLAGGARGPALLSPFLTSALAGSGLSRAAVLARPFGRAVLGSTALAGQRLTPGGRGAGAALLLGSTALAVLVPAPWPARSTPPRGRCRSRSWRPWSRRRATRRRS